MSRRAAIVAALVLSLALAAPLAVDGWLRGGHVTPEQSLGHARAVIQHGDHVHAWPASAAAPGKHPVGTPAGRERAAEDGVSLAAPATLPALSLWHAAAAALLTVVAPLAGRLGRRPRLIWPTGVPPAVAPPPPRSLAPARA